MNEQKIAQELVRLAKQLTAVNIRFEDRLDPWEWQILSVEHTSNGYAVKLAGSVPYPVTVKVGNPNTEWHNAKKIALEFASYHLRNFTKEAEAKLRRSVEYIGGMGRVAYGVKQIKPAHVVPYPQLDRRYEGDYGFALNAVAIITMESNWLNPTETKKMLDGAIKRA